MDYERIRNGDVPPDVAQDPRKLAEYANLLKQEDPDFDEASMYEWIALVKSKSKPRPKAAGPQKTGPAPLAKPRKTVEEKRNEVIQMMSGFSGKEMTDYQRRNLRQRLLLLEQEMNAAEAEEHMMRGMPIPPSKPRGTILNHFMQ